MQPLTRTSVPTVITELNTDESVCAFTQSGHHRAVYKHPLDNLTWKKENFSMGLCKVIILISMHTTSVSDFL